MSVNQDSTIEFLPVNEKVSDPKHYLFIVEQIWDWKVNAGVNENELVGPDAVLGLP